VRLRVMHLLRRHLHHVHVGLHVLHLMRVHLVVTGGETVREDGEKDTAGDTVGETVREAMRDTVRKTQWEEELVHLLRGHVHVLVVHGVGVRMQPGGRGQYGGGHVEPLQLLWAHLPS
jgi:hypothetical protein